MKRVLDFIKALGAFQGKRYDHSYIGRVSIAFWGEEDASCTFSCHRQWQKKAWNACAWKQRTRQESLWVFWKLGFLFSQYRSCNTQTGSFSNGDSVEDLFP